MPVIPIDPKPKTWQEKIVAELDEEGEPIYLGECQVWAVKSSSDAMGVHYVIAIPGRWVVCTCDGFRYRQKCRHRLEVAALGLDDEG